MDEPFRTVYLAALGAWVVALLAAIVAFPLRARRRGRDAAWPGYIVLAPLLDLFGTWAGSAATLALIFGRRGFPFAWAASMTLVVLMITLSLYDRAVLMPSLRAAWKRLDGGTWRRWEEEWSFLYRLATILRCGACAAGVAAVAFGSEA
ncbi:MAG: hypothetical protein ACREID_03335 [Planctomycetota bacterium]